MSIAPPLNFGLSENVGKICSCPKVLVQKCKLRAETPILKKFRGTIIEILSTHNLLSEIYLQLSVGRLQLSIPPTFLSGRRR